MQRENIKNIMIRHCDFNNAWLWIGDTLTNTLKEYDITDTVVLNNSVDIEKFIRSLIPTAIEFTVYRKARKDTNWGIEILQSQN